MDNNNEMESQQQVPSNITQEENRLIDNILNSNNITEETVDTDDNSEESESISEVPEDAPNEETDNDHHIEPNSPTLLLDQTTSRFSGAEWYDKIRQSTILIAGLGGIGSNLCYQIARMHPKRMYLYDPDTVDTENLSGQFYSTADIGKFKVSAIKDLLWRYTTESSIIGVTEEFKETCLSSNIAMCGFDNMKARKAFFTAWYNWVKVKGEHFRKDCLYLDGRLSIDTIQVLCIRGDDDYNMKRYQNEFLFDDKEAEETICSLKQTTYLACMIGSIMTNLFTNFIANSLDPVIPYALPFYTEYDAVNMLLKEEN